jgi:LmbE family N-acetylglucosaminyl deacetylase
VANTLVICAHPDDETLGLGGTLAKESKRGSKIFVLTFADGETSRKKSKNVVLKRENQSKQASKTLGITTNIFFRYKDQLLEQVPLLELAQKIEQKIIEWDIDQIFTHYWGDVNQDHRRLFDATIIACRPTPNSKISTVMCYETPSSTEWSNHTFKPNYFVDIKNFIKIKITALQFYKNEIQPYPHPRSETAVVNRSKYWGSQVGLEFAEPFIIIRKLNR